MHKISNLLKQQTNRPIPKLRNLDNLRQFFHRQHQIESNQAPVRVDSGSVNILKDFESSFREGADEDFSMFQFNSAVKTLPKSKHKQLLSSGGKSRNKSGKNWLAVTSNKEGSRAKSQVNVPRKGGNSSTIEEQMQIKIKAWKLGNGEVCIQDQKHLTQKSPFSIKKVKGTSREKVEIRKVETMMAG